MKHGANLIELDLVQPLLEYVIHQNPCTWTKILASKRKWDFGSAVLFYDHIYSNLTLSDEIGFKGTKEIEGPYVGYLEEQFWKPILLCGPVILEPPNTVLEKKKSGVYGLERSRMVLWFFVNLGVNKNPKN